MATCAQRRPGPESRQHRGTLDRRFSRSTPLNEGRDRNPGNTVVSGLRVHGDMRSTKAGTGIPATPRDAGQEVFTVYAAQRRPGPESRQHRRLRVACPWRHALNEGRDRNPGNTAGRWTGGFHGLRRSTKAGTGIPATPSSPGCVSMATCAQRRPGPESRQHSLAMAKIASNLFAQRRPGPESRQHNPPTTDGAEMVLAQRRPGPESRQHAAQAVDDDGADARSTKAGTGIPATLASRRNCCSTR